MNNCELIIRDIGSRKLYFLKQLKEAIGDISLKTTKGIVDCAPPFGSIRTSADAKKLIVDMNEFFKLSTMRQDWKLYLDEDYVLHFEFYMEHYKQIEFKDTIDNPDVSSYDPVPKNVDYDLIGYKERREDKLKDILD